MDNLKKKKKEDKNIYKGYIGIVVFSLIVGFIYEQNMVSEFSIIDYSFSWIQFFLVSFVVFFISSIIYGIFVSSAQKENAKSEMQKNIKISKEKIKDEIPKNIKPEVLTVKILNFLNDYELQRYNSAGPIKIDMYLDDNKLKLVSNSNNSVESYYMAKIMEPIFFIIPLSDITYYKQSGEIITQTTGTGGGSGHSLITGWNGKVKPVKINTEIKDMKHTRLYFKSNNEDFVLTFEYEDFHKFKKLLPKKDYEIVQKNLINDENEQTTNENTKDLSNRLISFKKLYDDNILTEEEYNRKKQEILSKM